jgi:hypothetical protein
VAAPDIDPFAVVEETGDKRPAARNMLQIAHVTQADYGDLPPMRHAALPVLRRSITVAGETFTRASITAASKERQADHCRPKSAIVLRVRSARSMAMARRV